MLERRSGGERAVKRRARRGIALPMVVLALVALGLLSSLALFDALQATRSARLAEDEAQARATALQAAAALLTPPDTPWLCLQPPGAPLDSVAFYGSGARAELRWWSLGNGRVRGEVVGVGSGGGRHRRFAQLRADSLPTDSLMPGCPDATGLRAVGARWLTPHPDG